ncbi:hypothetical protein Plim_3698 [Planctopirus limnophila DSM 3776]|uniref:Uncharacterized protein n=1 Tax=Planctopirus limnophila (strain ATCC 43296 / DSM 3776 / IFAM 1008 / Mu 290) TaxID=521674 RepID=D5SWB7_PLAL2|nr:hypothetical protein [Planctopirus limnophila]ADG69510.1 hypothetical protein Plim_3698 [Planctopirus limnophila DSM 3776]
MHLLARHFDGRTTHLLGWVLVAANGTAIIEASWRDQGVDREQSFEIDFPDARIRECQEVLALLKPVYNGCVDGFPIYELSVSDNDRVLTTRVYEGIQWPNAIKPEIDSFRRIWEPIDKEVEKHLAIPGRSTKRKK